LQEATGLFQERAKEKSIYLLLNVDDNVPNTICTDPTRLRQILINLIGNAVKFTNLGGIKIKVSSDKLSAGQHRLTFKIEDTGVGIEPAKRTKLFLPFAQADSSTTRKFGGTGLGLALSQRLAHALGGDIQLENAVSKANGENGSTFVFSYVVAVPQVATPRPAPTSQPAAVSASEVSIAGKRILVVDDSADNRLLVSRVLTRVGAEVALAVNGLEAVEKATASEYDMILMDIQMPEMDGYAATRALRSRGYSKPIVALSAHAMEEDQRRSLEAGCNAHLTKPVNQRAIYDVIKSMTD
jgi:CheY-like chemotaxis protein